MLGNVPLTAEQLEVTKRVFELTVARVLKRTHITLSDEEKQIMEAAFISGDDKRKLEFMEKKIPQFADWFSEELTAVEKEINEQMLLQQ